MAEEQHIAAISGLEESSRPQGVTLEFTSEPDFKLRLESLGNQPKKIELLNAQIIDSVMHAAVYVPEGKIAHFVKIFEDYATKDTDTGEPKHKPLAESISTVRLAALRTLWTDLQPFPSDENKSLWWEVWLRNQGNPSDVFERFQEMVEPTGIEVSRRKIVFSERQVLLTKATIKQWTAVSKLFDVLAELRFAKELAGQFIEMQPREQAEWVEDACSRIQWPHQDAPVVCLLDSGVNRGHPLLAGALPENMTLACEPSWRVDDSDPQQHGTSMAGLALYGCLTDVFSSTESIILRHGLESVKLINSFSPHQPELYGAVTKQAIDRAEDNPRDRPRVVCLTIAADSRDEGCPSSWSGAIDSISSGVDISSGEKNGPRRLLIVSAGNVLPKDRHEYPSRNELEGVEDPAQAWNAVTVGAYTEKVTISPGEYDDWTPIAQERGLLSPASRTSTIWSNKSWPFKPDVVFEGGNDAINPATKQADNVDDLGLMTTFLSPGGALLTTTGETSAATALASRFAATVYAEYPRYWPETVRGMMIHSARWTEAMLKQYPHALRETRMRVYGYGVPDIDRALWSAKNNATIIIEDTLQPFKKDDSTTKTNKMNVHSIPWPKEVLEGLGGVDIRMRITLSYFIEPSPGQRGWTRKHGYQSHGLRFYVRRPTDSDEIFLKGLSKNFHAKDEKFSRGIDDRDWGLGDKLQGKGSIHSDVWTGPAADLAASGQVAVYPVSGWWKERLHLDRWDQQARYSLIISLETDEEEVDLYTPIDNLISVPGSPSGEY